MGVFNNAVGVWRTTILGSTLAAVAICAVSQYWGISKLGQVAAVFRHGDAAFALAAEDMRDDVLQMRRFEKDVLLNVGSADAVESYREKWGDAFQHFRYDLARARQAAPSEVDLRLQEVVDSIETYQAAFVQTYDQIRAGTFSNAQQANVDANRFRGAARSAEMMLNGISERALERAQTVKPALIAQRFGLIVSITLFVLLLGLLVSGLPRVGPMSTMSYRT